MKKLLAVCAAAILAATVCAQAEAKTVLRYGTDIGRADTQGQGAEHFIKLVAEKTNGEIEIRFYPDSTLGSTQNLVSQARSGQLDIAMVGGSYMNGLSPKFAVLDLPFIFKDKDHAYRCLDGDIGADLWKTVEPAGLKGLAFFENGFRNITNNRKPIVNPEDVAGLKIRVPSSNMLVAACEALGATPVPMAVGELYTAMETGAIEAQDHPMPALFSGKFYEVQKYLSMTRHAYTAVAVVMNKKKFDKLTPEQQQILLDCAHEAANFQRDLNAKSEKDMIAEMEKTGLKVNYDVNADAFVEATKGVRDIYIKDNGDEFVKRIDALRDAK